MQLTIHTRAAEQPGTYEFDAVLKNLTAGTVIAEPHIVFTPGRTVTTTVRGEGYALKIDVTASTERDQATVELEYSVKGELVFAPRITLALR